MKWLKYTEAAFLFLFSGFTFLPNGISSFALIALLFLRLIVDRTSLIPSKQTILILIPPMIILLGWVFGGFAVDGLRELQIWASWIGLFFYFQSSQFGRANISATFLVSSSLTALYFILFLTFNDAFYGQNMGQNIRDAISANFRVHPTYLSAVWSASLLILWTEIKIEKASKFVLSAILILALAFSGGKMPLLALGIAVGIYLMKYSNLSIRKKWLFAGGGALLFTGILVSPVMNERFNELKSIDLTYQEGDLLSSTELRLGVWHCSGQMIKEHVWAGVGVGNTRSALESCYRQFHQIEFFEGEYNTHNQFMHFWLATGVIGITTILILIIGLIRWAHSTGNKRLFIRTTLIVILLFTENYLLRQKGMMLTGLMLGAVYYLDADSSTRTN